MSNSANKDQLKQKIEKLNKEGKYTITKEAKIVIDRMNRIDHSINTIKYSYKAKASEQPFLTESGF